MVEIPVLLNVGAQAAQGDEAARCEVAFWSSACKLSPLTELPERPGLICRDRVTPWISGCGARDQAEVSVGVIRTSQASFAARPER
jgi:hypothetical protein